MDPVAGPSRTTMLPPHSRRNRQSIVSSDIPSDHLVGSIPIDTAPSMYPTLSKTQPRRQTTKKSRSSRSSRSTTTLLLLTLFALILTPLSVLASEGDRSPEYRMCVASCTADVCRDGVDDGVMFAHRLPFVLRLTKWTCEDDCKYHCTHRITNEAHDRLQKIQQDARTTVAELANVQDMTHFEKGQKIKEYIDADLKLLRPVQKQMVQYHGKWVFIRFLGAQEPLSVLFSLLNLRVHYKALFMMRKQLPDAFPLKLVYIVHTLISINAWLWSAVFHTRDKPWTEKLDYFSAGAVIMSAFFFTACRLFRYAPGSSGFITLRRACIGALALHILYLSVGRFDYAYNMAANVVVGLIHTLLWLTYSLRPMTFPSNPLVDRTAHSRAAMRAAKPSTSNLPTPQPLGNGAATPPVPVSTNIGPPSTHTKPRQRLQLILALMSASVLLELLDFPPILRILDAHALWHLATVPITKMWYDWLVADAQECVSTGWWLSDRTGMGQGRELKSRLEQASEKLKGRAASLAQNIELNALTSKLNELANKAGFSGIGGAGANGGENASLMRSEGMEAEGLRLEMDVHKRAGASASTGIELGTTSLTDRDASGSSSSSHHNNNGKAKDW